MINESKIKWWKKGKSECALETQDPAIARQISTWKFARAVAWGVNHYRRVFAIPSSKLAEACRLLNISEPKKNPGRVKAGKEHLNNLKGQGFLFNANESTGQDG